MRDHETAAIKAEALREHATHIEQTGTNPVLWRDLDRGIDVRVSTLAWDAAGRYDEEAGQGGEGRIAALLADHWPHAVFGCECTPTDDETGEKEVLALPWELHVAAMICAPTGDADA